MTLPFRGRHHDGESMHDRARALSSAELLEPLAEDDAAWLAGHLADCGECRHEREAWLADRQLLRSLRDRPIEPPRDLWARTSAAIDVEARAASRRRAVAESGRRAGRDLWRGLPFGAAAGALVVLVVVGASIIRPTPLPNASPNPSNNVAITDLPQPTNLAIADARQVGWIRQADDGTWELVISEVDEVCPRTKAGCEPLDSEALARPLNLGSDDTGVAISPNDEQLVVTSHGTASEPGKVYVLPLSTPGPTATPRPPATVTPAPVITPPPPTPVASPIATPIETSSASPAPTTPVATPSPTPRTSPPGAIEIASGVTLVGEPAYNADGTWLAFSARPADSSTGPDLYLWRVGDLEATKVTDDHGTFFSTWLDGRVLASTVGVPAAPAEPGASGEPGELPVATAEPTAAASPELPGTNADASPDADATPDASAAPEPVHPRSFLLDPETGSRIDLAQPDVWLPVVDPAGRFTVYWSGTLIPTADGLDWQLAEGRLVLDQWRSGDETPPIPGASGEPPAPTEAPTAAPSVDPDASPGPSPAPLLGPAGMQVEIAVGSIAAFQAKFGPDGRRVAFWVADDSTAEVGRLHLVVLDPATGTVDTTVAPLPGEPALRRFSIDRGRLAWVSPRGQDGQESAVRVLAWNGREFGEIQAIPAKDLFLVR